MFEHEVKKLELIENSNQNGGLPVGVGHIVPETFLCIWTSDKSVPNFRLLLQKKPYGEGFLKVSRGRY